MIQRVVREGAVTISGRPVKAHYRLHRGEIVLAHVAQLPSPPADAVLTPQEIPLEVVLEDHHLLVGNKPAGLVTHPAPGHWDGTLVNAILWHLEQGQGAGDTGQGNCPRPTPHAPRPLPRAGIIHRLDKDTSGLLIVAKTPIAHAALSKQMKARMIRRRYLALVEGQMPLDEGTVNAAIGRHATHRKEMTIRHLGGRSAVTHYRVIKRFQQSFGVRGSGFGVVAPNPQPPTQNKFSFTVLEISLETGRTHQIRVHTSHLGFPIAGDDKYGDFELNKRLAKLGLKRMFLHAAKLVFEHPISGERMLIEAPLPAELATFLDTLNAQAI
jgi:23S rRNA pseudouridine1911/1915/1917 synthase